MARTALGSRAAAALESRSTMARALLVVDIQKDYFPGGAFPLHEPEAAADAAADLVRRFRVSAEPVIHVQHVARTEDAPFFVPGTVGVDIHDLVAPAREETVIEKSHPNAFRETSLDDRLQAARIEELVVVGMMTSMCVDATVRAAADLGYGVTVAHDACAAPELEFTGTTVPAPQVHAAFLAALSGNYAKVVAAADVPFG